VGFLTADTRPVNNQAWGFLTAATRPVNNQAWVFVTAAENDEDCPVYTAGNTIHVGSTQRRIPWTSLQRQAIDSVDGAAPAAQCAPAMENGISTHGTPERDLTLYNLQEGDPTIPLPHRLSQKQTAHSPASSTPKTGLRSITAASGTLAVTHTRHTGRSPTNSLPARSGARGLPDAPGTPAV